MQRFLDRERRVDSSQISAPETRPRPSQVYEDSPLFTSCTSLVGASLTPDYRHWRGWKVTESCRKKRPGCSAPLSRQNHTTVVSAAAVFSSTQVVPPGFGERKPRLLCIRLQFKSPHFLASSLGLHPKMAHLLSGFDPASSTSFSLEHR